MKKIGQGSFSKVFQKDSKTVLIKTVDPIKECMSLYFPECYLFPKLEKIDFETYEMKFFEKKKSLKNSLSARQWNFYKLLRDIFDNNYMSTAMVENKRDFWLETFKKEIPSMYKNEKEYIIEALYAMGMYGEDICFEISPRNVAVQDNKLVLLDCFFSASMLMKVRTKKVRIPSL